MRRPNLKRSRSAGFTLMEVLVASVLISTVFVAVMSVMSQSLRNIDRMRPHETALLHAREKMNEELLREQLGLEHSSGQWDDGYRWSVDIAPYELQPPGPQKQAVARQTVVVQSPQQQSTQPGLFKVQIQIAWGDRQSPRTYSVETTQWAARMPEKQ
jgi:type II secretion system protein I